MLRDRNGCRSDDSRLSGRESGSGRSKTVRSGAVFLFRRRETADTSFIDNGIPREAQSNRQHRRPRCESNYGTIQY